MSLSRDVAHDWHRVDKMAGYDLYRCERCRRYKRAVRPSELPERWCEGKLGRPSSLERTGGPSPVSDTNSGRAHQKDEAYRAFCRQRPCDACGEPPPSDPAHDRSWGAGWGDWIEGDGNLLSLCRPCHRLFHQRGRETFRELAGCDTGQVSTEVGQAFRER